MARTDLLFDVGRNDIVIENGGMNNSVLSGSWSGNNLEVSTSAESFYVNIPYRDNRNSAVTINGKQALGYVYGKKTIIKPYQLPIISTTLTYLVRKEYGSYVIYSGEGVDFSVGTAKQQNTSLLLLCKPGNSYRYPTSGVHLRKFVNSTVYSSTELAEKIVEEFSKDNVSVMNADFNVETGKLNITSEENI